MCVVNRRERHGSHHTRQTFCRTIGASALHENACLEFRHVRDHAVDAVLIRGVRIGRRLQPFGFGPAALAPLLPPPEEQALFGGESVHRRRRGSGRAGPGQVGHQREPQPAVVRGVLAERELAVDVRVAGDDVARILIRDAARALFERRAVGRGPPVAQVALGVVLPSLIVEAVGQLVADDRPDGAVVGGGVAARPVERRLQDPGREVDVVGRLEL